MTSRRQQERRTKRRGRTAAAAGQSNRRAGRRDRKLRAAARSATYRAPEERAPLTVPLTWVKLVVGVALVPVCWVTALAFFETFAAATVDAGFWRMEEFWFFCLGLVMWLVCFWTLPRPMGLYVLGHEVTHAFFILLCGGRIAEFKISRTGGYVVTDRTNVVISLSPYFVPIFTLAAIALFGVLSFFVDFREVHPGAIYGIADFRWSWLVFAAVGLTWAFHLTFTVWMIARDQPDLRENGIFFSLVLIFLVNLMVITAGLVAAAPDTTFRDFGASWVEHAAALADWAGRALRTVV